MTIFDMLGQSGVMTLLGMGIVFSFLVILVFAISGTGKIIGKFARNEVVQPVIQTVQKPGNDAAVTAAISAAVNDYRKTNN